MSEALYELGGLRFWTGREIAVREHCITTLKFELQQALLGLNGAWRFERMEGPLLTPRRFISDAYDDNDIFMLQAKLGEDDAALRAETTMSSYLYAMHCLQKGFRMPLCVWQAGKSFRRETSDGARASTLRYNEFYQLEFQCIFANSTKADYHSVAIPAVERAIRNLVHATKSRIVESDRLPIYSTQTLDVEVEWNGAWKEMASISTRTDFLKADTTVLEVAVGLDRLIAVEEVNRNQIL